MSAVARRAARLGPPGLAALWLVAALAAGALLWRVLLPSARADTFGFASYYTSARLAMAGELDPRIYDNAWFQAREGELGLRNDIYGHQPPTMALVMIPVAWLSPASARAAWLALDLLWLALGGLLAAAAAARGARAGPAAVALMLILVALFPPLRAELRYAQIYTLMALWYAAWLYGFVTGRDWLCGAALAALALVKLAGAPLWLLLLAAGRWRACAWAAALWLAALVASLPLVGADTWRAYLGDRAGDLAANPVFGVTALQTLVSLLRQLFVYDPQYTPAPLVHAPALATALWIALAVVLVALTLAGARRAPLLSGCAALCVVVPLQPAGEQHHYVLLLAPLFVAIILARRLVTLSPAAVVLAAAGAALLLAPTYFLDNAAWAGWPRALLAYPRLYGALLLWAAFLLWRKAELATPPSPETVP
jgi:hypothetical protein